MAMFRCWFDADDEDEDGENIDARSATQAAETFVSDTSDGGLSDYVDVCVRGDDGEATTWTVAIDTRTTYTARKADRRG